MNDRELLELAAKAAGHEILQVREYEDGSGWWAVIRYDGSAMDFDPLGDDGDALRLAAHLQIDVWHRQGHVGAGHPHKGLIRSFEAESTDRAAATRRAIVRAAAELARAADAGGKEG